jgi:hypothetical protein
MNWVTLTSLNVIRTVIAGNQRQLGKGKGGKGGKSGKGGKGGSGSGWTSDGYYGCLTLSGEEMYNISHHQTTVNCDYTVHTDTVHTDSSGNTGTSDGSTSSSSENESSNQG